MKKAMISQPMAGKTDAEITRVRAEATIYLKGRGYEVVDTLFVDDRYSNEQMEQRGVVNVPLCFLAKYLEKMAECDAIYFVKGWQCARGCRAEHEIAKEYGLTILY